MEPDFTGRRSVTAILQSMPDKQVLTTARVTKKKWREILETKLFLRMKVVRLMLSKDRRTILMWVMGDESAACHGDESGDFVHRIL